MRNTPITPDTITVKWTKHGRPNFPKDLTAYDHVVIANLDLSTAITVSREEANHRPVCEQAERMARAHVWERLYGHIRASLKDIRREAVMRASSSFEASELDRKFDAVFALMKFPDSH